MLPFGQDPAEADGLLGLADGLLMSGGNDPDPAAWGEPWHPGCRPADPAREAFERALIHAAKARRMPTLGICFGMQLMAIEGGGGGGGLIQFLPDEPREGALEHRKLAEADWQRRHEVEVFGGSALARITGRDRLSVNTNHRQSVRHTALAVSAVAPDGVIEAVEDPALPLWLGVQWHPERQQDDPAQRALFEALVRAAGNGSDQPCPSGA